MPFVATSLATFLNGPIVMFPWLVLRGWGKRGCSQARSSWQVQPGHESLLCLAVGGRPERVCVCCAAQCLEPLFDGPGWRNEWTLKKPKQWRRSYWQFKYFFKYLFPFSLKPLGLKISITERTHTNMGKGEAMFSPLCTPQEQRHMLVVHRSLFLKED